MREMARNTARRAFVAAVVCGVLMALTLATNVILAVTCDAGFARLGPILITLAVIMAHAIGIAWVASKHA